MLIADEFSFTIKPYPLYGPRQGHKLLRGSITPIWSGKVVGTIMAIVGSSSLKPSLGHHLYPRSVGGGKTVVNPGCTAVEHRKCILSPCSKFTGDETTWYNRTCEALLTPPPESELQATCGPAKKSQGGGRTRGLGLASRKSYGVTVTW